MPVKLNICLSSNCSSLRSVPLVRDIEELAEDQCLVEESGCLGHCGNGPNVEIEFNPGKKKVIEGVKTFRAALDLITDRADCDISETAAKIGKLKYRIRREDDVDQRAQKLAQAISLLGGEGRAAKREPWLFSTLLVLRSKEMEKKQIASALKDAQTAVQLTPMWPQAYLQLAQTLAASKRSAEGVQALQSAIDIGKGINLAAVKRMKTRLEQNAKEEAATSGATSEQAPGSAPAPEKKKKSSPKPKAKQKTKKIGSSEPVKAPKEPVAPEPEEEPPNFCEWNLESTSSLNHDCIHMTFRSVNVKTTARHANVGDAWHIAVLKQDAGGSELIRDYTPISSFDEYKHGKLELMVKVYPDGKMSSYLASCRPGCKVMVSHPAATLDLDNYKGAVMIAGGSAVTVALQVCQGVLKRHPKGVAVHLFMCNKTEEDILYRDVFGDMMQHHTDFHVVHCLSSRQFPECYDGKTTYHPDRINAKVLASTDPDLKGIVSGPGGLCQAALDFWTQLERNPDNFRVLDALPPTPEQPESDEEEDALNSLDPSSKRQSTAARPETNVAPAQQLLEESAETKAVTHASTGSNSYFFCNIFRPFWCAGRDIDLDDAEGGQDVVHST